MKHLISTGRPRSRFRFRAFLIFEPRDAWIGVYWTTFWRGGRKLLDVYVCVVPFFPVKIELSSRQSKKNLIAQLREMSRERSIPFWVAYEAPNPVDVPDVWEEMTRSRDGGE